jgi:hypothetical protein
MDKHLTERTDCEHLVVFYVKNCKGNLEQLLKSLGGGAVRRTLGADNVSNDVLFSLIVWVANFLGRPSPSTPED